MKLKDYDQNIDLVEAEIEKIHEKLADPNTTSEQRKELKDELRDYTDIQQSAVRTKNEYKNGWIPGCILNAISIGITTVTSLFVFKKVTNIEERGGVVSGQGVSLWDKIVRKF